LKAGDRETDRDTALQRALLEVLDTLKGVNGNLSSAVDREELI